MTNEWVNLSISFLFVIGILGITTILAKGLNLSTDVSRKIVHISVGHWIILAMAIFDSLVFLIITPVVFIVVNYISYRFKLIDVMEQDQESLGTVWYAVSLLILSVVSFLANDKSLAIIGILTMAYGDGFAALVGKKWGRHKWGEPYGSKSIEGSLTMFLLTLLVVLITKLIISNEIFFIDVIIISIIATVVELMSHKGKDNLFVPLIVSGFVWLFNTQLFDLEFYALMGIALLILSFGFAKKSITFEGMIHGLFVAMILIQFGQKNIFYGLILFFIVGSIISKIGNKKKIIEQLIHERTGPRNGIQVYANAGGAVLMVILGEITGNEIFDQGALIIFIAALADTMSSEIGMLSKKEPISIITFKKIKPGLSGGISLLGLMAGLVGSFIMSLILVDGSLIEIVLIGLLGFAGSLIDSFIGATCQGKYYDKENQTLTEKRQINNKPLQLKSGFKNINNDAVNFISTVLTSLIYVGIRALVLLS